MDERKIVQRAMEEHERLDSEIAGLQRCLAGSHEEALCGWFEAAFEGFRHLHTQLRKHMEMEEQDGFMQPVRTRRPMLTSRVDRLLQEHREMISRCVAIELFLEQCTKNPVSQNVAIVRARVDSLFEALQRHEADENRLVQTAFNLELGAGD